MSRKEKSQSYPIRNTHPYCFRMNIPSSLQLYIGKKELRHSLKTGFIGQEKHKARYHASQVRKIAPILALATEKTGVDKIKVQDRQGCYPTMEPDTFRYKISEIIWATKARATSRGPNPTAP